MEVRSVGYQLRVVFFDHFLEAFGCVLTSIFSAMHSNSACEAW